MYIRECTIYKRLLKVYIFCYIHVAYKKGFLSLYREFNVQFIEILQIIQMFYYTLNAHYLERLHIKIVCQDMLLASMVINIKYMMRIETTLLESYHFSIVLNHGISHHHRVGKQQM